MMAPEARREGNLASPRAPSSERGEPSQSLSVVEPAEGCVAVRLARTVRAGR